MKKPGSFLLVLTVLVGFTETEVVTKQEEKKAPGCMDRWGSLSKEGAEYYDICFGAGVCTNGEHPLRTEFGCSYTYESCTRDCETNPTVKMMKAWSWSLYDFCKVGCNKIFIDLDCFKNCKY